MHETEEFSQWLMLWKARLNRQQEFTTSSFQLMKNNNPAVIPRNHRVEEALQAAVEGDYSVMKRLINVLLKPYAHSPKQAEYAVPPSPLACKYRTFCGT